MRRFITSLTGRIFSHLVIVSLLVSFLATTVASRASAQVQMLPLWAVTEFTTHNGLSQTYGQVAADAISSELARTSRYQMEAPAVVQKEITTLGLQSPLQGATNLLRVGQELRATTIVTGDVIAAQIMSVGGGRQARVALRAVAYDVASGMPINGSAVEGDSTVRNGSVTDEDLIKDAIRAGSNQAVRQFQQHQLPGATVLNTLTDRCYINQGTRAGFVSGQQVVITRGREQVATGHIGELEPDEAAVIIERSYLGVAPGDHIRAIFPIPDIPFDYPFAKGSGSPLRTNRVARSGNNAGLVSLLVVVGLVGALLGNGGNSQNVLNSVTAEATNYPPETFGPTPAVKISWSPSTYAKGNSQLASWQIYRSDVFNAPVAVTAGNLRSVIDQRYNGFDTQYTNWTYLNGIIGGTTCNTAFMNQAIPATLASLTPGTPYTYQVELVYQLSSIDLPIVTSSTGTGGTASGSSTGATTGLTTGSSSTTGSGGTTTTGTTAGGTAGGTTSTSTTAGGTSTSTTAGGTAGGTSTSTTSGATICYFLSPKQSSGIATPLNPPVPLQPTAGSPIAANAQTSFQFQGSARNTPIEIEYVLQFSTSSSFPNNSSQTFTYPQTITSFGSGGSSGSVVTTNKPLQVFGTNSFLPASFQSAPTIFWRVGARATADSPGPVPDPYTKQRYIFCLPTFFNQKGTPPGTPSLRSSRHH